MRMRRLLGTALAAAVATVSLGAVSTAPASAATGSTKIVGFSSKSWLYGSSYKSQPGPAAAGDTIYFSIDVVSTTPGVDDPYYGTVKVERKLAGQSTWTTVATSTYSGLSGSTKAVKNASYRAVYSGGSSSSTTWTGSSATKAVAVQRKISYKDVGGNKVVLAGKVAPKYSGKVTILKKQGRSYKPWRTVRTNRKSAFRVGLPAPRNGKYYWQIKIAAGGGFATSQSEKFYTYSY
ncbi:hypothetical protein [Nocardioides sambongensis]|uniref:hypothetical protein n=1 Tax=Nocardioides sambongensis TaxID=2589074 RepID=UPI00112D08E8|nr:hypothetical protein [Nocardioides sambongensis]